MFKKLFSYIVIAICFVALAISTSRRVMEYIYYNRVSDAWWGPYDWKYGNLVGLSHLDFVAKFRSVESYPGPRPVYLSTRDMVLYLYGDSFTGHPNLKETDFAGVTGFHFLHRKSGFRYHLDSTKRNILIIEISEQEVRPDFCSQTILTEITNATINRKNAPGNVITTKSQKMRLSSFPFADFYLLFNKNINQNLQCNLFNYNFMMPMFSLKAELNYYLFNRASGDVTISGDRNFLFYKKTVTPAGNTSSYSPIDKSEITLLTDNLNSIYKHYLQEGFKEVFLSIIPNSSSINQPDNYNNLIPLIQNDKRLKMKVIDIYSVFKKSPGVYYLKGDSHWTNGGFLEWLRTVNEALIKNRKSQELKE